MTMKSEAPSVIVGERRVAACFIQERSPNPGRVNEVNVNRAISDDVNRDLGTGCAQVSHRYATSYAVNPRLAAHNSTGGLLRGRLTRVLQFARHFSFLNPRLNYLPPPIYLPLSRYPLQHPPATLLACQENSTLICARSRDRGSVLFVIVLLFYI